MKQDDVREIDGWKIVKPNDPNAQQQVNGVWYMPIFGSDSLQMALEAHSTSLLQKMEEVIGEDVMAHEVLGTEIDRAFVRGMNTCKAEQRKRLSDCIAIVKEEK